MKKIILLRGISASGKSSYVKELLSKGNYNVLSRDDIRILLNDNSHSHKTEELVTKIFNFQLEQFAKEDLSIIIDNTNLNKQLFKKLLGDLAFYSIPIQLKCFDISFEDALERDSKRLRSVGEAVLRKQLKYLENFSHDEATEIVNNFNKNLIIWKEHDKKMKPDAIIVDIDGTIAHKNETRDWTDWDKVDLDIPIYSIIELVRKYQKSHWIIFVSGRSEESRKKTTKWLKKFGLNIDYLFMRKENDFRPDWIVKKEIFENRIDPYNGIEFVVDDRKSVVRMWRKLGLKVLQVDEGDY